MNSKIREVRGTAVYIPGDDIDTDRIIPARFMRCVTFDGLGEYVFYDQRFDSEGGKLEHPLNSDNAESAGILITGRNFGCGSSREHAPQALYRFGFRGIIGQSFAEIFAGNCVSLGFPAVVVEGDDYWKLLGLYNENPDTEITIDLENRAVKTGGYEYNFKMPPSSHKALLQGKWDTLEELLENKNSIKAKHGELPYLNNFT